MIILSHQENRGGKMFERLRKIRQEKNIKAKEIAEKLGLKTEGAYYKKETGSVPFTLVEGKIIADIFKMPIEDIFFKDELS
jgi:transcriptional regulator with XRE-family HTH domain